MLTHNPFDRRAVVQRLERHNHLRGRTVRVRDDVFLGIAQHSLWVHLWHDQRHVRIIAIERRVIDDNTAGRCSLRRVFLGRVRANREQSNIPSREVERIKVQRREGFLAKADFGAERFAARKHGNLIDRELALVQNIQHFAAHIACGAYDDDFIAHFGGLLRLKNTVHVAPLVAI